MLLRNKPNAQTPTDPRVAELNELAAAEGIKLPMPADMIVWFEEQGFVVNFDTGEAVEYSDATPSRSGRAVAHLLNAGNDAPAIVTVDADDIDAMLEEVFGKNLPVEDSAGIFDVEDTHPCALDEGAFMHYIEA